MALNFTRDVKVILEDPTGLIRWEIPVLDGFSFSQAINASEITVNEAGATSRRARLLFNDSLAPVEWSFSTYARPTLVTSFTPDQVHGVEEALWAMFAGATSYNTATGLYSGSIEDANAVDATTNAFNFNNSNISAFANGWSLYFQFEGAVNQVYKITDAVVNSASIDFDIDGIATISWSGFGNTLSDQTTNTVAATIIDGVNSSNNFIRNRISTVDLVRTDKLVGSPGLETDGGEAYLLVAADYTWNDVADPGPDTITTNSDEQANISVGDVVAGAGVAAGTTVASIDATTITLSNFSGTGTGDLQFYPPNRDVYNLVLTGGSINFENNISYLTPEELGIVNAPIGNITGSRAISGNITCYLDNDVSSSKSGELFADLVSDTDTVRNTFDLNINIGGTAAPSLKFSLPTAHLEVPVINVEDLLTLDVAFHGQVSAGNVDSTNEATITYKGA